MSLGIIAAVFGIRWALSPLTAAADPADAESRAALTQAQVALLAVCIQAAGGAALLIGLLYTAKTFRLSQEVQITDRFTKAIDQLGSGNISVRIGGLYALQRIGNDSDRDYWPVIEIVCSFIRQRTEALYGPTGTGDRVSKPEADIQVALDILRRRRMWFRSGESSRLNLEGARLYEASLADKSYEHSSPPVTHWEGAVLVDANLEHAFLTGVSLDEAVLHHAKLSFAMLFRASLRNAQLDEADLHRAHLHRADFSGASLNHTDLRGADFENAVLRGAYLPGADLTGAFLLGADLRDAERLTQEQLDVAYTNEKTLLPDGLKLSPLTCPTYHERLSARTDAST